MKNSTYKPYDFDFKYEYKTYRNIGIQDKIRYKAKNDIFCRLRLKIRKVHNRDEKKYKNFNNYSEWEKYVMAKLSGKYAYSLEYYSNFVHYLKEKERNYKFEQSTVVSIFIPILILLATGAVTIFAGSDLVKEESPVLFKYGVDWFIFSIIVLIIFGIGFIYKKQKDTYYYFYKDYIKISMLYKKKNTSH